MQDKTIDDIKREHKGYFFSHGAMKAFRSIVYDQVFTGIGGTFFVTSERYGKRPRAYSVRRFESGSIFTHGDFKNMSKSGAFKSAELLAKGEI